ncbi:30 kDa heat shock protein [Cladorrhinum samala]|uniref:30 kDa heat shock protein n=1 Tax=Cladorrhinum samala TaxID=585594 RepID=A0AAV9HK32_9PEZI|nr:30 kDa heat shock protein [Cladorrhinum samala]
MSLWNPYHRTSSPGFSPLFRMLDDFDKYTQSAFGGNNLFPAASSMSSRMVSFSPKFDITEHDNHYLLQGELPGVPQENIAIEFTDPHTMVIRGHVQHERTEANMARLEAGKEQGRIESAEGEKGDSETASESHRQQEEGDKKEEKNEPKAKYWLTERSYGEFSRVFSFPKSVNQDAVEAKLENGLLNIMVPKEEKKAGRKIEIK